MTCNSFQLLKLICSCTLSLWKTFFASFHLYSFNKKKEDGFSCSLYLRFQAILSHYYPFDWRNTFIPKNHDDDHWKGEANWEEEEIVAKVIWSCPWWATAGIIWRWSHSQFMFISEISKLENFHTQTLDLVTSRVICLFCYLLHSTFLKMTFPFYFSRNF